ncbi:MAG: Type III pantothenate kinase [Candidatus Anoxychlamydiales bacterium]|nr:Type III pantothenate kinase [Candidatus Anoxychlamydiales bacterium]
MDKSYDLVIRVGNFYVRGALFYLDVISTTFHFKVLDDLSINIKKELFEKNIKAALICSNNENVAKIIKDALMDLSIDTHVIDPNNLSIKLDVENPKEIGMGRIANAYGALFSHPYTDNIVIDMETALTIDVITKEKIFLGGVICPSMMLSAKALNAFTDKLPMIKLEKPKSCLSRSINENIQSGIYYGLVGTIEKIVEELISLRFSHSEINVIATGSLAGYSDAEEDFLNLKNELEKDLKIVVDYFEPDLTFLGIYQILKEQVFQKIYKK